MLLLNLLGTVLICFAIGVMLPKQSKRTKQLQNMRLLLGYQKAAEQGDELGLKVKPWHYALILSICIVLGGAIGYFTNNILLVSVGVIAGFSIPKIVMEDLIYKRKRNVLINVVPNLRLLTAQLLEGGSLIRALELSLPAMSGATLPLFKDMHEKLRLKNEEEDVLEHFQAELGFSRIGDLCEKLVYGKSEGYHSKAVDSIRKTIDEINLDIQDIQKIEIENKMRRQQMILLLFLVWAFPFIFAWFESNMISISGGQLTIETIYGKILLAVLGVNTLLGILYLNRWTRFDMRDA